jgi:adenylylsulfate kinase
MSGVVVWFTGLPRSGKSTLAGSLAAALARPSVLLDGDALRAAISPRPGYDADSREHFYATLGNLAALIAAQGHVVLVAATAHRRAFRDRARASCARFIEVHVAASAEECIARDREGLYQTARDALPGAGVRYEPPEAPEVIARGGRDERALAQLVRLILDENAAVVRTAPDRAL